jgi:hypothetical protein
MSVHPLAPAMPEAARRALSRLPEFEPPARLRERVRAGWRERARRPLWLGAALAASLALLALVPRQPPSTPTAAGELATWQARSQALEAELYGVRAAAAATPGRLAGEAELARLDAALQAAYDRGAGNDELVPLWRARADALQTLVTAYRLPDAVVRI